MDVRVPKSKLLSLRVLRRPEGFFSTALSSHCTVIMPLMNMGRTELGNCKGTMTCKRNQTSLEAPCATAGQGPSLTQKTTSFIRKGQVG